VFWVINQSLVIYRGKRLVEQIRRVAPRVFRTAHWN
jgi:hypothetical protein